MERLVSDLEKFEALLLTFGFKCVTVKEWNLRDLEYCVTLCDYLSDNPFTVVNIGGTEGYRGLYQIWRFDKDGKFTGHGAGE